MQFDKYIDTRKGIFVTKPSLPPLEEYVSYLQKIWDSSILTNMGPLHEEFRERLTKFLDAPLCLPSCNGHMALELTIQAYGLKDEIITTPYTFASTTHAIVRNGCTPVFCDINEDDCTLDTDKLEELITDKTVAIVPVHVYGMPCNVEEIEKIAKKHNLIVIYDAAHAFGVKVGGNSIAKYGDASMFSFHATKAFNTIEGGCVALSDTAIAVKLFQLANFGIMGEEVVTGVGANAKMNEFQAAMGLCNLDHFKENVAKRKEIFELYKKLLPSIPGIKMLKPYREDTELNYAYCPVFFDETVLGKTRDQIYDHLLSKNIYTRKYFYPLTSEYECYKNMGYKGNTEVALKMSKQVLTLPIYPDLEKEDVEMICNMIKEFVL